LSSPRGMKSTGREFTAAEKLAAVEREIIDLKKKVKKIGVFSGASLQMDTLRAVARDYRAAASLEKGAA
jgi:hypothetical protein